MGRHPVHALDHPGDGAGAVAVQHPHRDQLDLLGHAVGGTADGAGDVRAVAVAVLGAVAVVDDVVARLHPASEVLVGGPDAGVDDVGGDALAGLGPAVVVVQRQRVLVDAVQTPAGRVG